MKIVFNTELKKTDDIFKHFGSNISSSAERIEGLFYHQGRIGFDNSNNVYILDANGNPKYKTHIDNLLTQFCSFAESFTIHEYELYSKNPLRINDLWEDDPIGSAGPNVINRSLLTESQQLELDSLFYPYSNIIYPEDVFRYNSASNIMSIKRKYSNNIIFRNEINKRVLRCKKIGINFSEQEPHEIIWVSLSLKLREWALTNSYDSFVYANEKESNGSDSFIALNNNQAKRTNNKYKFSREKYLDLVPSKIKNILARCNNRINTKSHRILWGQEDPNIFWKKTS